MPISNRMSRRCFVPRSVVFAAAAVLATVLSVASAAAQHIAPSPPPADQPSPAPAPSHSDNPGLVNEIKKLLKTPSSLLPSTSLLPSFGRDSKDTPTPPAPTTPPQAASPAPAPPPPTPQSLPMVPEVVGGHQICPVVQGSGPDCQAAADILCRSKGYRLGKSLGVDSTEKCSAKVLIPGRSRQPGDCRTENFVTRAWCQ
ncbi:hypothetical protein DNX69_14280 [Rhodopseudomonas palustris]|uniref:Uncharacterized protein n=1 Tax=Rhodopseudomonas palustris TaxID=1076 RepID=A0A323USL6_RHOPL|nr:hypothetical protein [Rhodopseudomonas palustris]PZA10528.1 hypothetical protein DNX69_14280 [Rhodopseudomonas palustris]